MLTFSDFASSVQTETAFDVLAVAKRLKAAGKRVVELEIGDSPFPTPPETVKAGTEAIVADHCHYGPSAGLPEFRQAAAEFVNRQHGLDVTAENIIAGPGAKTFQTFFCEAVLNPGDGVLLYSPHFPTYVPNIQRRGGRIHHWPLRQTNAFRPDPAAVERFLADEPRPKAIFLNSPHNPTGGIALEEDLRAIADLVRGRDVALFSDEPYDQMVWQGEHHTILRQPGMIEQCVAAYTFSKSYSMSGWRLGFSVSSAPMAKMFAKLTNTVLSCVPPFSQLAGIAALRHVREERDRRMQIFRGKVTMLVEGLSRIEGVHCLMPGGTFYVFPSVAPICNRLGITSHGLAMYLLEGADDEFGVACLGGECFGPAGEGFLRFSCAEPDELIQQAIDFLPQALSRTDRVEAYLRQHEAFRLPRPYEAE